MVAEPQQVGYHRLRWNGCDDAVPVQASADEVVLTLKLTLLR